MMQFHIAGLPTDWQPVLPFTKPIDLKFDERVNVFVGPNAVGKSTILRELGSGSKKNLQRGTAFNSAGVPNPTLHGRRPTQFRIVDGRPIPVGSPSRWVRSSPTYNRLHPDESSYWENEPCSVYVPAIRSNWPRLEESGSVDTLIKATYDEIASAREGKGYNTALYHQHLMEEGIFHEPESSQVDALMGIAHFLMQGRRNSNEYQYDPQRLYHAVQFIEGAVASGQATGYNLEWITRVAHNCVQDICSDMLTPLPPQGVVHSVLMHSMGVLSAHIHEGEVFAGDLSSGTQGTLLWIWNLCTAMALYHRDPAWADFPAVLLIDEIENHLHPTWQRRVIPALLEHFPRLQIFATTHSPFVIAGLKAGQVHLLNRDANGVVTASSNTEEIIGWTADEILRVFMGVDDPTDDATAAVARELRQLRDAGPHPDEREEEQRQARMRELQQQVDRNLLAGGPRAAEEERFAENLNRILEKYRLTKDLNQENG